MFLDFLKQGSGNTGPHSYTSRLSLQYSKQWAWTELLLVCPSPHPSLSSSWLMPRLSFHLSLHWVIISPTKLTSLTCISPWPHRPLSLQHLFLILRKSQLYHSCYLSTSEESHSSVCNGPYPHMTQERGAQCCMQPRNPQKYRANCWSLGKDEWIIYVHYSEQCQQEPPSMVCQGL